MTTKAERLKIARKNRRDKRRAEHLANLVIIEPPKRKFGDSKEEYWIEVLDDVSKQLFPNGEHPKFTPADLGQILGYGRNPAAVGKAQVALNAAGWIRQFTGHSRTTYIHPHHYKGVFY